MNKVGNQEKNLENQFYDAGWRLNTYVCGFSPT